jgi:hypothetical protein
MLLGACSQEPALAVDAGTADAAWDATEAADLATGDTFTSPDVAPDAGPRCDAQCRTVALIATVGAASAGFDRAYYGLTAPASSTSGRWEVHVEVHAGGPAGCPTQESPTPDQTLIVTGMTFPEVPLTVTDADGLVVSLLDFSGALTAEPVLRANGEELTWIQWDLCTDCEGDDPNGFLAFDLAAPLDAGRVEGHVYATHCASMDSR